MRTNNMTNFEIILENLIEGKDDNDSAKVRKVLRALGYEAKGKSYTDNPKADVKRIKIFGGTEDIKPSAKLDKAFKDEFGDRFINTSQTKKAAYSSYEVFSLTPNESHKDFCVSLKK